MNPWVRLEALELTHDGGLAVQGVALDLSDNLCSLLAAW